MNLNTIYNEPCLETLKKMPDSFLDSVITSPPYWQLRDYGYPEQWGLEPTFQEYLEHLWAMMDEIKRTLKDSGTVWINLGDSYSTQSGTCSALAKGSRTWKTDKTYMTNRGESGKIDKGNLPTKSLLLLPHRFAIGCIDRGWRIRNDIIWAKRNGMPESVTDRFSKKHEYFFLLVKSDNYYFDLDSVKDLFKASPSEISRQRRTDSIQGYNVANGTSKGHSGGLGYSENGKNPGDVADFWDIPTKPSSKKHYAQYNDELLKKPIIAGSPRGGVIYDPFSGTGTTAKMCIRTERNFIGSEMSKEYYNDSVKELALIQTQQVLAL